MAGTTAEAQVQKKPYKNQTAGYLGVVKLDHLGGQIGHSIPPFGTAFLSDEEAILTARAPANAKDNPFEEQEFMFADENGAHVLQKMRPLILLTDADGVPEDDRFVPTVGELVPERIVAERARTDAALDAQDEEPRAVPTEAQEPTQVTSLPVGAAVDPAHSAPLPALDEQPISWTENPDRTEEPQEGTLGGSDEPAATAPEGTQESVSEQATPPQRPAPTTVGSQPQAEEHAGVTQTGEETGAADRPAGDAPEGEFAQHEEVGSPDAPSSEAAS